MGGTRCIFRKCGVTTQHNPKMHFFRLPMREPELLLRWLKNCDRLDILNLETEQQANRAVCAHHFRYGCFMNYKLDRLVPGQVPTLIRLNKQDALDVEQLNKNGEPTHTVIHPSTLPHLIPPKDFVCPLGLDDQNEIAIALDTKNVKILKRPIFPSPHTAEALKRMKFMKSKMCQSEDGNRFNLCIQETKTKIRPIDNNLNTTPNMTNQPNTFPIMLKQPKENIQRKFGKPFQNVTDPVNQVEAHSKDNIVPKAEKVDLGAKLTDISVSFSKKNAMSKSQLFDAIKKYLSPTMATLVRMEMFASAERSWEIDERAVAVELLQLGEHVYKHCSEEWRFRLPALKEAYKWSEDNSYISDEDDK